MVKTNILNTNFHITGIYIWNLIFDNKVFFFNMTIACC